MERGGAQRRSGKDGLHGGRHQVGRAGNFGAATDATGAATAAFEKVKPALAAKAADAALKTAMDAYAGAAVAGGEKSKVATTGKAAQDAVAVAQQVVAGQFWTQPAFQQYLADLSKA